VAKPPVPSTATKAERTLAYLIVAVVGLSIIAIFTVLIAAGFGANEGEGLWPVLVILPEIGLPIGFVLILVLLLLASARRSRAAKGAGQ
jgi:hypothetical protein